MRKYICIIGIALALCLLVACTPAVPDEPEEPFSLAYGTAVLTVGMEEGAALDALGEGFALSEAESCAGQGTDRMYTYPSLRLYVFAPVQGKAIVQSVTLIDDGAATVPGGVTIGSHAAEMARALGEPQKRTDTTMTYLRGGAVLTLTVRDGAVTALTLTKE